MKVAIVSGGASGIGQAVARALAREGYQVVVLDVARPAGLCGTYVEGDVSRSADCEKAVSAARSQGGIHVLCNVAGIRPTGGILQTSEETWDRVMAVNLKGMFLLSRAVIPHMQAAGGGVIVNTGSTSGYAGKDHIAYCTAKGAVIPFTKSLALDHAADRIRVNAVVPGFTQSGMTAGFAPGIAEAVAARSVAGRVGLPEDIAAAVCFLASDAAATISGAVLEVGVLPGSVPGAG
jgi:meso-butanediol dehydrogenase/(S,S)-butanediol dehydrogenase/diacetyl reductase